MRFKPYLNQDYASIKSDLLKNGQLFEDPQFGATEESICKFNKMKFIGNYSRIEWRRPKQIVANPKFIVNGISSKDINQSKILANCWFLAAAMGVTTNQKYIKTNVPEDQSFDVGYCGIFHFRFWQYGHWYDVVIDDRLPYCFDRQGNGDLMFSSNKVDVNEFWSPLLEKAYAKLITCYEFLGWGYTNDALVDLTGGVSEVIELSKIRSEGLKFWESLSHAYDMGSLCGCSILEGHLKPDSGLQDKHAYSITKVTEIKPTNKYYNELLNTVSVYIKKAIDKELLRDFKQVIRISKPNSISYGWRVDDNQTGASNYDYPSLHFYSSNESMNQIQATSGVDEYATGCENKDSNDSFRLIRLRNPMGSDGKEWKGRFSDDSKEWQKVSQSIKEELGLTIEQDGEFWMEFDDFMHHFSRLQFVHVDINAFKDEVSLTKAHWRCKEYHCDWVVGKNAGGSDVRNDSYWTNPQFFINVKSTDRRATDSKTTLIVSLMYKDIIKQRTLGKGRINEFPKQFRIYRVKENVFNRSDCTKLSKDSLELVESSNVQCFERELTQRFRVASQHSYVIIPSANTNTPGSFLLRLYTEIDFEEEDCRELNCAEIIQKRILKVDNIFDKVEKIINDQYSSANNQNNNSYNSGYGNNSYNSYNTGSNNTYQSGDGDYSYNSNNTYSKDTYHY